MEVKKYKFKCPNCHRGFSSKTENKKKCKWCNSPYLSKLKFPEKYKIFKRLWEEKYHNKKLTYKEYREIADEAIASARKFKIKSSKN